MQLTHRLGTSGDAIHRIFLRRQWPGDFHVSESAIAGGF
jgi:hypothetical protein